MKIQGEGRKEGKKSSRETGYKNQTMKKAWKVDVKDESMG